MFAPIIDLSRPVEDDSTGSYNPDHRPPPAASKTADIGSEPSKMTDRDEVILDTLTRRVRVLSLAQVARVWWGSRKGSVAQAKNRLRELEGQGWVEVFSILARPEPPLDSPVTAWTEGGSEPDFGAVSYRLRSRWTEPARHTVAVIASERAGSRFGGAGGRRPRASEGTHDLCLAAVYLRLLATEPKRAARWISEAKLFESGEGRNGRLPDAAIVTRAGKTVIEFGGAYPPTKIAEFHRFCADRGWGYELW